MSRKRIHRYLRLGIGALLAASLLSAAGHRGLVKFGGLPVPGAVVTATQGERKLGAITDPQGVYTFADLPVGVWTIRVEMLCFEPSQREVTVQPDAPAPEFELKLLPFEQIQAAAPPAPPPAPVSTAAAPKPAPQKKNTPAVQAANTSTAFQRTDVNAAASTPPAAQDNAAADPGELNQTPADGFLVNGSVNNGASTPFAQAAAFGNNRFFRRSLYNGSLGFTFRGSALDARSYSLTGQDTPKPDYSHLQGMAAFGGPLRIPRLVRNGPNFTVTYQWVRNRNASVQTSLMPAPLQRSGDFSQTAGIAGEPVAVLDPSTGQPFAANAIPEARISPQARALLGLYPLPNFETGGRYNYQIPLVGSTHQDNLQARANRSIGRSNSVNGGFAMQSSRSDSTNLFGFLDLTKTTGLNTNASWMHRFTNRFFTTLTYQFSRMTSNLTPFFANRRNVSGEAGITGNNQAPENWGPPALSFAGGIAGLSDAQWSSTRNQTSSVAGSIFWSYRSHNITAGGEYRRQQFNQVSQQDARGAFTFTGAAAGNDFAGFLLGIPDTASIAYGNADKYFRSSTAIGYFTDDWRFNASLTINWGLRWEYNSPITERYGRLVNLDIAPGFTAVAPVVAADGAGPLTGRRYPASLLEPVKTPFQPRVGISWRPFLASSVIVRAGYGVYYDTGVYTPIAGRMAQQSPLSKSLNIANTAATPLTLANGFYAPPSLIPNTFAIDPDFRVGYSQNWQVSVQRDLPASLVGIVSYLGIKGSRAQQQFLPNTYPAGAVNPCPACPSGYAYLVSNGNSSRQSGTVQLRRRLHNGFTAQAQYTFSKALDNATLGGRGGPGGPLIAQDWLNLNAERGRSNFDQRHLLTLMAQYTTGMGLRGGTLVGGWKGGLFKDWTIGSQITAGSGLPLTPIYLAAVRGTGVTGSIRPDFTGADLYDAPAGFYLNPAAVAPPAPGRWGNAGRNSITGPAQFNMSASMSRTFRFSDRINADFRIDAQNPLNTVTFPSWNTMITSAQFGLPVAANAMRSVQTNLRVRF